MAANIEVLSDKNYGAPTEGEGRPTARVIHVKVTNIGNVAERLTPAFIGNAYRALGILAKNVGTVAFTALDLAYGFNEAAAAEVVLDDSKDHWEKETGFSTLAVGNTRWAFFSHCLPEYFALQGKTASAGGEAEFILTFTYK